MRYHERVLPSAWVYIASALVLPAVILIFWPIHPVVGIILAVVLYAGLLALLVSSSPIIEVSDHHLRVGSARVPLRFVGEARPLDTREAARAELGPDFDARAWTCIRGWVPTAVRVQIEDANDPVPYWLFSSRDPHAVVTAISEARAAYERHHR